MGARRTAPSTTRSACATSTRNGARAWRVPRTPRCPAPPDMEQRHQIEERVYRPCLALDDRRFTGFLALCDPRFRYKHTVYSPEIRKGMARLARHKTRAG